MSALTMKVSRALIGLSAWLVPAGRRARWRREWLAELAHADAGNGRSAVRSLRRALLSFGDALDARRHAVAGPERAGAGPGRWLDDLRQDAGFGVRALARAPGVTVTAAATIALGVGLTTAIFSLVNGILLQPLPYSDPERLVLIWPEQWFSSAMMARTEQGHFGSLSAIGGYQDHEYTLLGPDGAERVRGPRVTAGFFDVLGREVVAGRTFAPGDDRPGSNVAVVTHAFWRDRLAGDPEAVGGTIRLGRGTFTVIGVLRPGFDLLQHDAEIVTPWTIDAEAPNYTSQELKLLGRLRDDATMAAAAAELGAYVDAVRAAWNVPEDWGRDATVQPFDEYLVGTTRPTLLLLFGAVGLTLLIATANVAGLLLARALGRQRELAVRSALGARRGRLMRQLITEATLLATVGMLPGLALAHAGLGALTRLLPPDTPRLQQVALDGSSVAFAFLLTLATGWIVGAASAWQVSRAEAASVLTEATRGASDSRGRRRLRSGIVMVEIALAVTLAVGAGVLFKSFLRLQAVDPGFRTEDVVTFRVEPVEGTFQSALEAEIWFDAVRTELSRLPGVVAVTEAWKAPYVEDGGINGIRRTDRAVDPEALAPLVRWRPVPADYFQVAGLRLLAGRTFDSRDGEASEPVAVISARTAQDVFGAEDPIGKAVSVSVERDNPATVIGVVDDVRLGGLDGEPSAVVYRPYEQIRELVTRYGFYARWLVLRTEGPLAPDLAAAARRIVRANDPEALVADFTTLQGAIGRSIRGRRATTTLMASFAAAALLLGAIGTYGVMAYSVRQRYREIGIRVALGATRRAIVGKVLREALTMAALGAALGITLASLLSGLVRGFVFEVDPLDPAILVAVVGVMALVALGAALGPAWRAGCADPARTLGEQG